MDVKGVDPVLTWLMFDWIDLELANRGMSVPARSRALGIARTNYYHYLARTRVISFDMMRSMCQRVSLIPPPVFLQVSYNGESIRWVRGIGLPSS